MIYTRNKQEFKKTTTRVDHVDARKNILNLVKERIGRNSHESHCIKQNQCKNNQKQEISKYDTNYQTKREKKHEKSEAEYRQIILKKELVPKICESLDSSLIHLHQRNDERQIKLVKEHAFDYTFTHSGGDSALRKAHNQYVNLLENKISDIERKLQQKNKKYEKLKSELQTLTQQKQTEQKITQKCLLKYYHNSRTVIINQSAELIQCKKIISDGLNLGTKEINEKLYSLNSVLGSSEKTLEIYRKILNKKPELFNANIQQQLAPKQKITELTQLCQYQQKTIQFLRKQKPLESQFNQIKLLRYEINRLSVENQKLIKRLAKCNIKQFQFSPSPVKSPQKAESPEPKKKQIQTPLKPMLSNKKLSPIKFPQPSPEQYVQMQIHEKLIQELKIIKQKLKQEQAKSENISYKFRQQKEVLLEFLEEQKTKNQQIIATVRKLQQQLYTLEGENNRLKNNIEPNLRLDPNKSIASPEQLCRDLKPYPNYFKLFMLMINQYQQKISTLQERVSEQRLLKDKFMQWSSSIYKFMQKSELSQQTIQEHMAQLFKLDKIIQNCKLQKLFRQIRSLSIGVNQQEMKRIQGDLQQYVVTLKQRNMTIKELECEDGSSLADSDTFTDRQFQEQQ